PEADAVAWRRRVDDGELRQAEWLWGLTMVAHVVPFLLVAVVLIAFEPLALPVSLVALAHAWIIPELYAQRGANVARPPRRRMQAPTEPERVALGLLGDLVGHDARELHARTGLIVEHGRLGVWLVGQAGALLVRAGGRRVHCWCVRVDTRSADGGLGAGDPDLPAGDRIAHLLLALRLDEEGFATVANRAFAGARWRVRRRLDPSARPALDHAARLARG
ncbi:MAG TPA: hypothetical protein VGW11_05730, partial [Solirubrobacteraceae bacterium]|nr:hypothetical protein [Solirubrobacteraceae bacterium]